MAGLPFLPRLFHHLVVAGWKGGGGTFPNALSMCDDARASFWPLKSCPEQNLDKMWMTLRGALEQFSLKSTLMDADGRLGLVKSRGSTAMSCLYFQKVIHKKDAMQHIAVAIREG